MTTLKLTDAVISTINASQSLDLLLDSQTETEHEHIKKFAGPLAACYIDKWQGYNDLPRERATHFFTIDLYENMDTLTFYSFS